MHSIKTVFLKSKLSLRPNSVFTPKLSLASYSTMSIPKTQKVVLVREPSKTPDAIEYTDFEAPQITGPHDVIIKHKFGGVNFIDSYFRQNIYPATYPHVFGQEGSGIVAAVGDKVSSYKVGDKVAYLNSHTFAQYSKIPEDYGRIYKLPENSTDNDLKEWAAILTQGLTAVTLMHESHEVKKGQFVVVWAAAGGMGRHLTRYGTSLGARVIAIASTDEKLKVAKDLGAEFLIRNDEDVAAKVKEYTNGVGAHVVYDGVGLATHEITLEIAARKGTVVFFGNASGVVPPLTISRLTPKNLKLLRPSLYGYTATREEFDHWTGEVAKAVQSGSLDLFISKTYPLSEYKEATTALEGRKTTGKLVLEIPE